MLVIKNVNRYYQNASLCVIINQAFVFADKTDDVFVRDCDQLYYFYFIQDLLMAQKKNDDNQLNNTTDGDKKVNVHEGHRDRVRQKIRANGIESLPDHEVLEYLLFMVTPRKDVNGLAHELINTFGGFDCVLDASEADLLAVKGVTKPAALFLSNYTAIYNKYLQSKENKKVFIRTLPDLSRFFINRIGNSKLEILLIACFDISFRLKRVLDYTSNDVSCVMNSPKQLLSDIVKTNCSYVAIAHNHPGGSIYPSIDDLKMTHNFYRQLQVLDVRLLDSLVITYSNATSILTFARTRVSVDKNVSSLEHQLASISSPLLSTTKTYDSENYKAADYYTDDYYMDDYYDDIYETSENDKSFEGDFDKYSGCVYHEEEDESEN